MLRMLHRALFAFVLLLPACDRELEETPPAPEPDTLTASALPPEPAVTFAGPAEPGIRVEHGEVIEEVDEARAPDVLIPAESFTDRRRDFGRVLERHGPVEDGPALDLGLRPRRRRRAQKQGRDPDHRVSHPT